MTIRYARGLVVWAGPASSVPASRLARGRAHLLTSFLGTRTLRSRCGQQLKVPSFLLRVRNIWHATRVCGRLARRRRERADTKSSVHVAMFPGLWFSSRRNVCQDRRFPTQDSHRSISGGGRCPQRAAADAATACQWRYFICYTFSTSIAFCTLRRATQWSSPRATTLHCCP